MEAAPAAPPPVTLPRTGTGASVDTNATPAMLVGALALAVLIALASALRRRHRVT
jgi:hypothetical protein